VFFIAGAGAYGDDVSERVLVVRSGCLKGPVQSHNKYISPVFARYLLMIERHRERGESRRGWSGLIKFARENMSHEAEAPSLAASRSSLLLLLLPPDRTAQVHQSHAILPWQIISLDHAMRSLSC
jgi:hypothetical protein